jgi:hypothetical protein
MRKLFFIVFVSIVFSLNSCQEKTQGISILYFCDHYKETNCKDRGPEKEEPYAQTVPEARAGTWRDLSYYMYFHTRQTPGLLVEFNFPLKDEEFTQIRKNLRCHYTLSSGNTSVTGEMEGIRFHPDGTGFWCFDYLGTMLIEYHKKAETLNQIPPKDRTAFPFTLEISFDSGNSWLKGSAQRTGSLVSDIQKK